MLQPEKLEQLICLVSAMERIDIVDRFMSFRGRFPIDFTRDFLSELPIERLRHIFVAMCLQSGQVPQLTAGAAA